MKQIRSHMKLCTSSAWFHEVCSSHPDIKEAIHPLTTSLIGVFQGSINRISEYWASRIQWPI